MHTEGQTSRGELFQLRSAYLYSKRYGICGRADLIEERDGTVYPVEYKKGRLGNWTNDALQLCAQALCLEEALSEGGRYRPHPPGIYLLRQHWATQSGAAHTGTARPDARDNLPYAYSCARASALRWGIRHAVRAVVSTISVCRAKRPCCGSKLRESEGASSCPHCM